MNKINGTIISAGICAALSLSAFALPSYASAGLNAGMGAIKENQVPSGYRVAFASAQTQLGMPPDRSQFYNTVSISEKQLAKAKTGAEKLYKDTLGITIPKDFLFSYRTEDRSDFGYGFDLNLYWKDERINDADKAGEPIYRTAATYYASFAISATGSLLNAKPDNFMIKYSGDTMKYGALRAQAIKALKDDLGVVIPENFFTKISIYGGDISDPVFLDFDFSGSEFTSAESESYKAGFVDVDLPKITGKLTTLMSSHMDKRVFQTKSNPAPLFTDAQKAEMIAVARQVFEEKGDTNVSVQATDDILFSDGRKGLTILFSRSTENPAVGAPMSIHITSELEVLGYAYGY